MKKSSDLDVKSQLFSYIREHISELCDSDYQTLDKMLFKNRLTIRLHLRGFNFMQKHFETFSFDLQTRLSGSDLLTLKQQIQFPYFLSDKKLYIFSSKDAFVLKLNGGNVKKWLDSKKS